LIGSAFGHCCSSWRALTRTADGSEVAISFWIPFFGNQNVLRCAALAVAFALATAGAAVASPTVFPKPFQGPAALERVLYAFPPTGGGAKSPNGGLVAGAGGTLIGTSFYGGSHNVGAVFALTPPSPGKSAWTQSVLHSFSGPDGEYPAYKLIADSNGSLYGSAGGGATGGGCIFRLTPPAMGTTAWTETVLHSFNAAGNEGINPEGTLLFDRAGNIYGTAQDGGGSGFVSTVAQPRLGAGVVYELIRPVNGKGPWPETVLYTFSGGVDGRLPSAGVIADASGNLYGTTSQGGSSTKCTIPFSGCGVVFELSPPAVGKTAWTETILHSFSQDDGWYPQTELLMMGGALFGTTIFGGGGQHLGNVFKLTPPAAGENVWRESNIYVFPGGAGGYYPQGLISDANGVLYGTTGSGGNSACSLGCGTTLKLTPPAVGHNLWTETILHAFAGGTDGYGPGGPLLDLDGRLYGTAAQGGAGGEGILYTIKL
jgi:hypothetical protein